VAYSVDWIAKVITVPTSDLTLVSGTRYSLDLVDFLGKIRELEASFTEGLWAPQILEHANSRPDFVGVDYVAFDKIINGYTLQITGVATRVDLLGSNNNIVDVLIPTAVAVVPSNSAGKQSVDSGSGVTEQDKLDIAAEVWASVVNGAPAGSYGAVMRELSFGDMVHVEAGSGNSGTTYPTGTFGKPVDNILDAITIATAENLDKLHIHEDIVVPATANIDELQLIGVHATKSQITLTAGCSTDRTLFTDCQLTGVGDGQIITRDSFVQDLSGISGVLFQTAIGGTITPSNQPGVENMLILQCYANASNPAQAPIFDFVNSPDNLVFHDWHGPIRFENKTSAQNTAITYANAHITFDSSCTAGAFYVGGISGVIQDNSTSAVYDIGAFTATHLKAMYARLNLDPDVDIDHNPDGSMDSSMFNIDSTDIGGGVLRSHRT